MKRPVPRILLFVFLFLILGGSIAGIAYIWSLAPDILSPPVIDQNTGYPPQLLSEFLEILVSRCRVVIFAVVFVTFFTAISSWELLRFCIRFILNRRKNTNRLSLSNLTFKTKAIRKILLVMLLLFSVTWALGAFFLLHLLLGKVIPSTIALVQLTSEPLVPSSLPASLEAAMYSIAFLSAGSVLLFCASALALAFAILIWRSSSILSRGGRSQGTFPCTSLSVTQTTVVRDRAANWPWNWPIVKYGEIEVVCNPAAEIEEHIQELETTIAILVGALLLYSLIPLQ